MIVNKDHANGHVLFSLYAYIITGRAPILF